MKKLLDAVLSEVEGGVVYVLVGESGMEFARGKAASFEQANARLFAYLGDRVGGVTVGPAGAEVVAPKAPVEPGDVVTHDGTDFVVDEVVDAGTLKVTEMERGATQNVVTSAELPTFRDESKSAGPGRYRRGKA